jgi:hypothetical protein
MIHRCSTTKENKMNGMYSIAGKTPSILDVFKHNKMTLEHKTEFNAFVMEDQKYLSFEPWNAGFNNVRMSLEIAVALCILWDRTLVLPPKIYIDHLGSVHNTPSTYIDLERLIDMHELRTHVRCVAFDDIFKDKCTSETSLFHGINKHAMVIDGFVDSLHVMFCAEEPKSKARYNMHSQDKKMILPSEKMKMAKVIHFPANLFGNFYTQCYTDDDNSMMHIVGVVARAVVAHKHVISAAVQVAKTMQTFQAMHIRRGDFLRTFGSMDKDSILNEVKRMMPQGGSLYIATDEQDLTFFDFIKSHCNPTFLRDFHPLLHNIDSINYFQVEQYICSMAQKFVGTEKSTFSTYIKRLRALRGHAMQDTHVDYSVIPTWKFRAAAWDVEWPESVRISQPHIALVISRFNENVDSRNQHIELDRMEYIYCKDPCCKNRTHIHLPNIGRECHTYLTHIVNNYDKLEDVTIFAMGSCFTEDLKCNKLRYCIENVHNVYKVGCVCQVHDDVTTTHLQPDFDFQIKQWKSDVLKPAKTRPFGSWYKANIEYETSSISKSGISYNSIFATTRERITSYPICFYKNLLKQLDHNNTEVGHYIERIWHSLYCTKQYFCTYGDDKFISSKQRIMQEVRENLNFHKHVCYDEKFKLSLPDRDEFTNVLNQPRGGGYWMWKPFVICDMLSKMCHGDILVYLDCGRSMSKRKEDTKLLNQYFEELACSKQCIMAFNIGHLEYKWTKGDTLSHFGVREDKDVTHTPQFDAGCLFIRKTDDSVRICHLWKSCALENPHLFDDSESKVPNIEGFIENRYEQSVLGMCLKKNRCNVLERSAGSIPFKLTHIRC